MSEKEKKIKPLYGGVIKAVENKDGTCTVTGPGVMFSDDSDDDPVRDLYGEYFTKNTYFGRNQGNGVDAMFNHGFPLLYKGYGNERLLLPQNLYKFFKGLANHNFEHAVKTKMSEDETHLAATLILNLRNEYEMFVAQQAKKGLLSWSSATAPHTGKLNWSTGEIKRWPIIEFSLTPTPAEPRTTIAVQKSFDHFLESADYRSLDTSFGNIEIPEVVDTDNSKKDQPHKPGISLADEMEIQWQLQRLQRFANH